MSKKEYKDFLDRIQDIYGDSVVYTELQESDSNNELESISTGSLILDISSGVGGVPLGKITTIFGPESVGKSTLSCSVAKNAIQSGHKVLYIDVENMLDFEYTEKLVGTLDRDKIIVVQPDTSEDSFKIAELGINSKEFGLIIFDSIGALAPIKEKEDDFDDVNVALVSRQVSKFLRRNAYSIRTNKIAFLFLNQVRDSIGSYMSSYSMPGGHALKHYSSIIILLGKGGDLEFGKEKVGIKVKFTFKKNKLAPPYRAGLFPIMFGIGIDTYQDTLDFSSMVGVVTRSGPYYKFEEEVLGRGAIEAREYLQNNQDTLDKIWKLCYNMSNKNQRIIEEMEE